MRPLLLLASIAAASALVVAPSSRHPPLRTALQPPLRTAPVSMQYDDGTTPRQGGQYDVSAPQFDVLSLRSFRRDTILQYDATNQSEPLRIALCLLGILFSLCVPTLFEGTDAATVNVAAVAGTAISGTLFVRNRSARSARMAKIDNEYAMGDLRATYRGVRSSRLSELRNKRRVVVLFGPRDKIQRRVAEARVYRRRLVAADAVVVPVYTDGGGASAANPVGEAESRWLWAAAEPEAWRSYFEALLGGRGLSLGDEGAWVGLNYKGRSFGSAKGAPRWDEMLGTALQPSGDGFGELAEVRADAAEAAREAAAAATGFAGAPASDAAAVKAAEAAAASVLGAQQAFYAALLGGDATAVAALWTADGDEAVSDAVASGARVEPWEAGSNAFPPPGMRLTDCDVLVLGEGAMTTAIERPAEGGTLLASQRWRLVDGRWRLATHRYIPWSADGATAVATLRCDRRGCVLLGREINTREVVQRGAVLMDKFG